MGTYSKNRPVETSGEQMEFEILTNNIDFVDIDIVKY